MSIKVAVVTGAAQGVGFETSQLLAKVGYHVVMTDVQPLDGPVACVQAGGGKVADFGGVGGVDEEFHDGFPKLKAASL